jgi:hypothetical protein
MPWNLVVIQLSLLRFSPLTLTLSPLRGEGTAIRALLLTEADYSLTVTRFP